MSPMSPHEQSPMDRGSTFRAPQFAEPLHPDEDLIRLNALPKNPSERLTYVVENLRITDQLHADFTELQSKMAIVAPKLKQYHEERFAGIEHALGERLSLVGKLRHSLVRLAVAQDFTQLKAANLSSHRDKQQTFVDKRLRELHAVDKKIESSTDKVRTDATAEQRRQFLRRQLHDTAKQRLFNQKGWGEDDARRFNEKFTVEELRSVMDGDELQRDVALSTGERDLDTIMREYRAELEILRDQRESAQLSHDSAQQKLHKLIDELTVLTGQRLPALHGRQQQLSALLAHLQKDFRNAETDFQDTLEIQPIADYGKIERVISTTSEHEQIVIDDKLRDTFRATYEAREQSIRKGIFEPWMSEAVHATIEQLCMTDDLTRQMATFHDQKIKSHDKNRKTDIEALLATIENTTSETLLLIEGGLAEASELSMSFRAQANLQRTNDTGRATLQKRLINDEASLGAAIATYGAETQAETYLTQHIANINLYIEDRNNELQSLIAVARANFDYLDEQRRKAARLIDGDEKMQRLEDELYAYGRTADAHDSFITDYKKEFDPAKDKIQDYLKPEQYARLQEQARLLEEATADKVKLESELEPKADIIMQAKRDRELLTASIVRIRSDLESIGSLESQQSEQIEAAVHRLELLLATYKLSRANYDKLAEAYELTGETVEPIAAPDLETGTTQAFQNPAPAPAMQPGQPERRPEPHPTPTAPRTQPIPVTPPVSAPAMQQPARTTPAERPATRTRPSRPERPSDRFASSIVEERGKKSRGLLGKLTIKR